MENQNNSAVSNNPKKNTGLIIALIIFIAIAIGFAIWAFVVQGDVKSLKSEKEAQKIELTNQLNSLIKSHDQLKAKYGQLSDSLVKKDSLIMADAHKIKKLLGYRWEYFKVKKKITQLQHIEQGFVRQLDSLYRVNKKLKTENHKIKELVQVEKKKNKTLLKEKENLSSKVAVASVIPAYNVNAEGIHITGSGRERKTDKIKRINKLKVCFTLGANKITTPGNKNVYIRIAQPNKKILTPNDSDEFSFMYKGNKLQYSILKEINYENTAMDICVFWSRRKTKALAKGTYNVDIYEGNSLIGHTSFKLR